MVVVHEARVHTTPREVVGVAGVWELDYTHTVRFMRVAGGG